MPHQTLITIRDVSLTFPGRTLFRNLSLTLAAGRVVVLAGPNGSGKSTLLQLIVARIANEALEDTGDCVVSGRIVTAPGVTVAYLPQHLGAEDRVRLATGDTLPELQGHEAQLNRDFGLPLTTEPDSAWSEGELQKRAIVRTLLTDCDLYLFDEPTNFLDIRGILAFEQRLEQLKRQGKGIILVTHDRTLADFLGDETFLLAPEGIYRADAGLSAVSTVHDDDIVSRRHRAHAIGRKISALEKDMRAKAGWAARKERQKIGGGSAKGFISARSRRMARRAKAVQKRLEDQKEQLATTRPFVPKQVDLHVPPHAIRRRDVFTLGRAAFAYPSQTAGLLSDITLAATTRSRICLMGANGSGKTTLLKLCQGLLKPTSGTARVSPHVPIFTLDQGLEDFWTAERLLDNFADCEHDETTIRRFLGAALLRREKVHEPLDQFSQGELMRAAVVKCILARAEFLFLDEPTTHLDIESIEVLERLLSEFQGGFLLVSHDRSFVEGVAERLFVLDNGRLREV